jgi:alpha-tubulin suppressor-like RCC1 family protein
VTCALSSAKDVWCWGFNANGSVGIGKADTADHFTPKPIPNFKNVSLVRATSLTVCAVKTDATAWCWGRNNWGQVGTGGLGSAPKPTRVATKVKEVRPGGSGGPVGAFTGHTCFVYTNRSIGCAGDNSEGQLGRTTKLFFSPDIAQVGGLTAVTNASAGGAFTCAVKAGAAWCWGSDKYGQLGDGTAGSSRRTPARVALP